MSFSKYRTIFSLFISSRQLFVKCLFVAFFAIISVAVAQNVTFFRIGTGSTSGTYFPIGALIGAAITSPPGSRDCEDGGSCGVPGLIAAAQTTRGSIENIKGVLNGTLETGLAQSDVVYAAFHGQGAFEGNEEGEAYLRVIANLYPENFHLVVRNGAEIETFEQLKGKRVSIDLPGSGTHANARTILKAFGIGENDYVAIKANPDKSVNLLKKGELDAFFFIAGYPASAVVELANAGLISLLPISGTEAGKIIHEHRFFSLSRIPADTYKGIGEVPTLAVSTQWVVNAKTNADLVYGITRALWHPKNRKMLDSGHAKGKLIRLETALKGIATPLHPGAEKFYLETP